MWNVITAGFFLSAITLKWLTQGHSIPVPPKHWFAFITDKTLNAAYWDTSILMMVIALLMWFCAKLVKWGHLYAQKWPCSIFCTVPFVSSITKWLNASWNTLSCERAGDSLRNFEHHVQFLWHIRRVYWRGEQTWPISCEGFKGIG